MKKQDIDAITEVVEQINKVMEQLQERRKEVEDEFFSDVQECSICGKEYKGFGNNAQPINDGRCCDECNNTIVLERRLRDMRR